MLLTPRRYQERNDNESPTLASPEDVQDLVFKESLHTIQHSAFLNRLAQISLPKPVEQALANLNKILTSTPIQHASSVTQEIRLPASHDADEMKECVETLSREVAALYFPTSDSAIPADTLDALRNALSVLCTHFQEIASLLQETGYARCFVAGTRNSFADHFHVHDFYTYILYCGREVGTEVVVGALDTNNLSIEERKDSWQRHTHRINGAINHSVPSFTSDTDMGLLLPPFVAHRACRSVSQHGKAQSNFALVLTAFMAICKEIEPGCATTL
jgi:hypothetical protein